MSKLETIKSIYEKKPLVELGEICKIIQGMNKQELAELYDWVKDSADFRYLSEGQSSEEFIQKLVNLGTLDRENDVSLSEDINLTKLLRPRTVSGVSLDIGNVEVFKKLKEEEDGIITGYLELFNVYLFITKTKISLEADFISSERTSIYEKI